MSVLMGLRIEVDPARFEQVLKDKREVFQEVSERAKQMGAIHHQFLAGDGVVMAADEWEKPEDFQAFFEASGEQIGGLMAEAGVTNQPEPTFWRRIDSPDAF